MKLRAQIKMAKTNLLIGKMRTLLAVLGVLVGTASVVALISSSKIATEAALQQFQGLGINLMALNFSPISKQPIKLTIDKLIPPESLDSSILVTAPYSITYGELGFENTTKMIQIIGATQNLASVMGITMQKGRFLNKLDKFNLFCIVGQSAYQEIFHNRPVLGRQIRVGNLVCTIIGVANSIPENAFFSADLNNSIILPLIALPFMDNNPGVSDIMMKLTKNANLEEVKEKINQYFVKKLPDFKINIQSAKELIKSMAMQHDIFTWLLGSIGAISLLVGGIGVMNIMLAVIAERRQEIGLRLAIGAEPKDIQWMFLTEAGMLGVLGGGIGVILGVLFSYIVSKISGWPFTLFFMPPFIGFSVSVLICIIFGFFPAYKASRLNPIETLRRE